MKIKEILKKCMWGLLVLLLTYLMIQAGKDASDNIWIEGNPTFRFYVALLWEILMGIAVFVPLWLLVILGFLRCYLGDNWFPFEEKIPIQVTKVVLIASVILMIGVSVAGAVYSEHTEDAYRIRYAIEEQFDGWQTVCAWTLFYSILLYIKQWCMQRNCGRKNAIQKQAWTMTTIFLAYLIITSLGGVDLWYIPLSYVDCPNRLEDYYLWWFSLYIAVSLLPLCFFSARKTIRLFKNNKQWLTLSSIIPAKINILIAAVSTYLMISQIQEIQYWNDWTEIADVPEYGEAAAIKYTFLAMMWGLLLCYAICLLIKQIRAGWRAKRGL